MQDINTHAARLKDRCNYQRLDILGLVDRSADITIIPCLTGFYLGMAMSLEHSPRRQKLLASAAARADNSEPTKTIVYDDANYSLSEFCAIRKCSPATIYRELARGIITAVKDGKNLRFKGRVIRERLDAMPEFVSRDAEALQRISSDAAE